MLSRGPRAPRHRKDAKASQCRSQLSVRGKLHLGQRLGSFGQEMCILQQPTAMRARGGHGCPLAQGRRLEGLKGHTWDGWEEVFGDVVRYFCETH